MMRATTIALSLCACTPVIEETDAPTIADSATLHRAGVPTIPHEPAADLDPVDVPAEVDSVFACTGEHQHVAKYHYANLELRKDGTFELHFADVSDDGGRSLWMLGTWEADRKAILLQPESGLQRSWSGDAHREVHGEPSGYSLDHEGGVYTHERRLPVKRADGRIAAIRIDEIATSVYPQRAGVTKRCEPSAQNP